MSYVQDIRGAVRAVARHPRHLLASAATLALGIGANVAIFTVFESVVLRPLPYPRSDAILAISADRPFTLEELDALRERSTTIQAISSYETSELTLIGQGEPALIEAGAVSSTYVTVFGRAPALGRWFAADDERRGAGAVVVLGDGVWRHLFSADPNIVGRRIRLRGAGQQARTVIGVMPRDFRPLDPEWQAWVPAIVDRASASYRGTAHVLLVGRLAPGATVATANADIRSIVARLMRDNPERKLDNVHVQTLHAARVGNLGRNLAIMLGAVGIVLLIACFNVASLALARADQRTYEVALKMSFGIPRRRLFRQLLTESVFVALVAGAVGVGAAALTLRVLGPTLPATITEASTVSMEWRALAFALLVSLVSGVLFGLAPALRLSRTDLMTGLRAGASHAGDRGPRIMRGALVAGEIALSLSLVTGGGVMLKSLWVLNRQPSGFAADRLLTLHPLPSSSRYRTDQQRLAYQAELQARIAVMPTVQSVASGFPLPMSGEQMAIGYDVDGAAANDNGAGRYAALVVVTPGYFATLGIRLLQGRAFTVADRDGTEPVALVSRRMMRAFGGSAPVVGRQLRMGGGAPVRIVGVVDDVKGQGLAEDVVPTLYRPYAQEPWVQALYVAVRTSGRAENVLADVRRAVWSVDAQVPIASMRTMASRIAETQADPRFFTLLLLLSSAIAISLAGVGAYGVMSVVMAARRREYGIRLALGAVPGDILRRALAVGGAPVVAGLVLGVGGAWAFTRWLRSLVYGVQQFDLSVVVLAAGVLGVSAYAALYIPARRAAASDPGTVLRSE